MTVGIRMFASGGERSRVLKGHRKAKLLLNYKFLRVAKSRDLFPLHRIHSRCCFPSDVSLSFNLVARLGSMQKRGYPVEIASDLRNSLPLSFTSAGGKQVVN